MSDEFGILTNKEQAFVDAYTEKIRKEERERIAALVQKTFQWKVHNFRRDFVDVVSKYIGWTNDHGDSPATVTDILKVIKGENE